MDIVGSERGEERGGVDAITVMDHTEPYEAALYPTRAGEVYSLLLEKKNI